MRQQEEGQKTPDEEREVAATAKLQEEKAALTERCDGNRGLNDVFFASVGSFSPLPFLVPMEKSRCGNTLTPAVVD